MTDKISSKQKFEILKEFRQNHPEMALADIAKHFEMSTSTVWRYLKKAEDASVAEMALRAKERPRKRGVTPLVSLYVLSALRRGSTVEQAVRAVGCSRSYAYSVQSLAKELSLL